jgi:hypothetical protein
MSSDAEALGTLLTPAQQEEEKLWKEAEKQC